MRTEAALILDEPAPCDDCASAELCRFTGAACKAFAAYIEGKPWESLARTPSLRRGNKLGIQAAALTSEDRQRLRAAILTME